MDLNELNAINKRYICTGCGLAYATNSLKDFVEHCVDFHDDIIEDFVVDQIAFVNPNLPEAEDDSPYDLIAMEMACPICSAGPHSIDDEEWFCTTCDRLVVGDAADHFKAHFEKGEYGVSHEPQA